jgi:hypothetical protein
MGSRTGLDGSENSLSHRDPSSFKTEESPKKRGICLTLKALNKFQTPKATFRLRQLVETLRPSKRTNQLAAKRYHIIRACYTPYESTSFFPRRVLSLGTSNPRRSRGGSIKKKVEVSSHQ